MTTSDSELLQQFAHDRSEKAFATLVSRHVDLVYSAALRQVRSPQLAEEVSQSVFLDLSRNADKLKPDTILTAWLYRVTRRTAIDVVRSESRRQLREQISVELATMNSPDTHWTQIEPLLDEAMDTLDEADRSSILLRYFENKSLREVGQTLGTSDDAAQKRVSRAVERLREFFSKRGLTVGASGLAVVISANAVQAAPIGFALTISSALAGTTVASATTATAIKTIAMTTLQKSLITAIVVAAVGAGIYGTREASTLRMRVQSLEQQQQAAPVDQLQQLSLERDEAQRQLAGLREENERLNRNSAELIRLRGEVTRLRQTSSPKHENLLDASDPKWRPNWRPLELFDLSQFPDSALEINRSSATNAGITTPAALLQTWIWAQSVKDPEAILATWDFPENTSEDTKMARVQEAINDGKYAQQNPDKISFPQYTKLRDMFSLGEGYYLAFIESKDLTTKTFVSHQIFRRIGNEWRVSFGKQEK